MSAEQDQENKIKVIPEEMKPLGLRLRQVTDDQTYKNMIKLAAQDEFECPEGSGKKYKRKMLKPKQIVELYKLQTEIETSKELAKDPQKRFDNIKAQAKLCLEGFTDKDWEETDAVLMEIIVGACYLISKGFRQA